MANLVKIAVIDNGINELVLKKKLKKCVFIREHGDVRNDVSFSVQSEFQHGTYCALIIEKKCGNSQLFSVRILDEFGRGMVDSLESALMWCYENGIYVVNLSLGTTHFLDKGVVRNIINKFANKLVIISATANSGFTTYPASFSNVIGVEEGERFTFNREMQLQKGIDFIAPSNHVVRIRKNTYQLEKSNSYATPYVTALVGNLIYEKGFMTVDEIRNNLCVESNSFIYSPDWIESAWITPDYRKSKAEYYFNADKRDLTECIDDIDTVVFLNAEDIEKYADLGKHIVYIGNDKVSQSNKKHHFWSRELRHEQIISSKERPGEIDIPSICCIFDNQVDIIWCLCVLKELFENEGYNAFVGCDLVDSVLYDLEYLPDGDTIQEKLADFVYWQTYYQQSDIILVGKTDKDNDVIMVDKPDMTVYFNLEKNGIAVKMLCDGEAGEEKYYTKLDIGSITKIYGDIIGSFEKEDE